MKDMLTEIAGMIGNKMAIIEDRPDGTLIEWTYAQYEENANKMASILRDLGINKGDKVIWCGPNSHGVVASMAAIRKVGGISVPLNYRLSPEEAAYVVDNSDARFVIADAEYVGLFTQIRKDIPKVEQVVIFDGAPGDNMIGADELLKTASGEPTDAVFEEGEAGSMIYTSGTTGRPKGAVRDNAGDPENMAMMIGMIGYTPDDVYLTTGPLYHSGPSSFMGIGIMMGQTIILQRKFDAEDWVRLVDKYKVTSTFSAPTTIRRVTQLDPAIFEKYDVSSMRIMIANAAPWSYALKKEYLAIFPDDSLIEVYGSTELGVNTILMPPYQLSKPGSCGQPAPGVEIFLFDEEGNEVTEPHVPGELFVRSKSVFSTYHKAEDQFEEERKDDKQTVGDVAYFDEDGFYYICDRKKDMIISGGMNIYPAEIEDAIEHHPDVMDVAVFGIPNEEWGESVHAIVVAREGSGLTDKDVMDFAREHLAGYKVPRSVDFIDEIPRTGSGKILKRELRAPYWKDHQSAVV